MIIAEVLGSLILLIEEILSNCYKVRVLVEVRISTLIWLILIFGV